MLNASELVAPLCKLNKNFPNTTYDYLPVAALPEDPLHAGLSVQTGKCVFL